MLVLRHDVDQHPATALKMAAVEHELGVASTWYFRWRTASGPVVDGLRERGCAVGLHYETLSRQALAGNVTDLAGIKALVPSARYALRAEIAAFDARFGPCRTVCPHGDTRVPQARNAWLLQGQQPGPFGISVDANAGMTGRDLDYWLTDRSRAEGAWQDAVDPMTLVRSLRSPILCVTHPNNWCAGPSLWVDRAARGVLGAPRGAVDHPTWTRTGSDDPPI
ncbi:MAG: hypothetical protein MSC31_03440 [Solirubrobacteraceae bacterium MAG38_C4-C5]|nr:hypothetical protein [Candidatus Siliceabacter maunaloa]